jgi:hypothetical protein
MRCAPARRKGVRIRKDNASLRILTLFFSSVKAALKSTKLLMGLTLIGASSVA